MRDRAMRADGNDRGLEEACGRAAVFDARPFLVGDSVAVPEDVASARSSTCQIDRRLSQTLIRDPLAPMERPYRSDRAAAAGPGLGVARANGLRRFNLNSAPRARSTAAGRGTLSALSGDLRRGVAGRSL
jgi:hypothetical protein